MNEIQRKLYPCKINILSLNYVSVKQKEILFNVGHIKFTLTIKEEVHIFYF